MADGYIGEIRAFGFDWAPEGWLSCNGQSVQVAQYQALYVVIGNYFGGDQTQFNLPNLQGRVPMDCGQGPGLPNVKFGLMGGEESVTIDELQMPYHTHQMVGGIAAGMNATGNPDATCYLTRLWQTNAIPPVPINAFIANEPNSTFSPNMLGVTGGGQPHENRQPSLVMNFCICWSGEWPPHQ